MKYSVSVFAFGLMLSMAAHATTILSIQSVTADAGTTGAFDVSLTNTGPAPITVGAFTFGLSSASSNISFTDANTSTVQDAYIFAGNSLFGPDLTGATSGTSISVSDVYATPQAGATVASGATFDLGHILFSVSPNAASGVYTTMLLLNPSTSLSDPLGNSIVINAFHNGSISVVGAAPEPVTFYLILMGAPLMVFGKRLQRAVKK